MPGFISVCAISRTVSMMAQRRHHGRVERYLQQIQSTRDQRLPTCWGDFMDTVIIGTNIYVHKLRKAVTQRLGR